MPVDDSSRFEGSKRALRALIDYLDEMPAEIPNDAELAANQINRALELTEKVWVELSCCGLDSITKLWSEQITTSMNDAMKRPASEICLGETRAMITSALYDIRYRLPIAGEMDSRMVAAMDATEIFRLATADVEDDATPERWIDAFAKRYFEKVSDTRDTNADYEKVRKSIQRFKVKAREKKFFRFDEDQMRIVRVPENEIKHGLSAKKGRRKN